MSLRAAFLGAALLSAASGAAALDMPAGAQLAAETRRTGGSYAVLVAGVQNGAVPMTTLRGPVLRQAWHLPDSGLTPYQVIDHIRASAAADGFYPAFDCETDLCGGFDFRFAIDVMDAPDIFVNLRDFHFATLLRGPEGAPDAAMTVLASRTQERLYVQIATVNRAATLAPTPAQPPVPVQSPSEDPLGLGALLSNGHVALDGLEFDTGAAALGAGPFEVLGALAALLTDNPGLQVALVGHTDSVGALEGNIALSRQRAEAVRARLIERYGIDGSRMEAEGMGYLAPRASNLTPEGREANRRVEVILLSEN